MKENAEEKYPALKDYIRELFHSNPTAYKQRTDGEWQFFDGTLERMEYGMVAVGAFLYKNDEELSRHLERGNLDAILAFEFGEVSTVHFYSNDNGSVLVSYLKQVASEQGTFVVQIH